MSEKKSRQQKDCRPSQFYLIYRPDDRDAAISTDAPKSPTIFGATHGMAPVASLVDNAGLHVV